MPVPKRKTSKAKRNQRKAHQKIDGPEVMICPNCGEAKQPHHVCPECGTYKGRNVIKTEE